MLDTRTRLLVLTGQFTMSKSWEMLEDNIHAAIAARVEPREVLEIILQCAIYGGQTTVDPAIRIFHRVAKEKGLIEELRKSQKPMDNNDSQRNYEEERKTLAPGRSRGSPVRGPDEAPRLAGGRTGAHAAPEASPQHARLAGRARSRVGRGCGCATSTAACTRA